MYAVTDLSQGAYTSWRRVEPNWLLNPSETRVSSLDGLICKNLPSEEPCVVKLKRLTVFMLSQPTAVQVEFLPLSSLVKTALEAEALDVAKGVVHSFNVQGSVERQALKEAVLSILNT